MKLALLTHKLKLVVRSFFERLNIDFCSFFKMVNRVIKIEDAIAAGTCKVTFEFAHDETGGNRYNKCVIFDTDNNGSCTEKAFEYIRRREALYVEFMDNHVHAGWMNAGLFTLPYPPSTNWMAWLGKCDTMMAYFGRTSIDRPTRWLINLVERNVDGRTVTDFGVDLGGDGHFVEPADRDWLCKDIMRTHLEFKFMPCLRVKAQSTEQVALLKGILGEATGPNTYLFSHRVVDQLLWDDDNVIEDRYLSVYKVVELIDLTNDNTDDEEDATPNPN